MYQRRRHVLVVCAVLLAGAARDRDGDRSGDVDAAQHSADKARDAPVTREVDLVLVVTLPEEASGLQEEAVECLRMTDVGVQHRERPQARTHADPPPVWRAPR